MFGSGQLQATFGWAAPFFGMSLLSLTFAGIIGSLPHDLFTPADRRAVEGTPTEPATAGGGAVESNREAAEMARARQLEDAIARRAEAMRARRVVKARARLPGDLIGSVSTVVFFACVLACGIAQVLLTTCATRY